MTILVTTASKIVGYLFIAIAAVLIYGYIVLVSRAIRKKARLSYRQLFRAKTLDSLPIISLVTLFILFLLSPFGIPDMEDRVRVAHEFGVKIERPITAITHAFIHADLDHFLGNVFFLSSFGVNAEFQQRKRWQLATIAIAFPLGMLAIFLYEFVIGGEPEEPVLGSSIFLYTMIVVSLSGIARYCWDRIRGDSSHMTTLATAVIVTVVIFAADTKFLTDWIVSQVGHFLGMTAGVLLLSVRAICGGKEMGSETRGHLDKLAFIYEKRWKSLVAAGQRFTGIVRAKVQ